MEHKMQAIDDTAWKSEVEPNLLDLLQKVSVLENVVGHLNIELNKKFNQNLDLEGEIKLVALLNKELQQENDKLHIEILELKQKMDESERSQSAKLNELTGAIEIMRREIYEIIEIQNQNQTAMQQNFEANISCQEEHNQMKRRIDICSSFCSGVFQSLLKLNHSPVLPEPKWEVAGGGTSCITGEKFYELCAFGKSNKVQSIVENKALSIAELLPLLGFNKGICGDTPLHIASRNGHLDVVKYLCKFEFLLNAVNHGGLSPIMLASVNGHKDVVRCLCHHQADINVVNYSGQTSLILASVNGRVDVVRCLGQFRADANAADRFGQTALMFAAFYGNSKVAHVLLEELHANFLLTTTHDAAFCGKGATALQIAQKQGHLEIVNMLFMKAALSYVPSY